MGTLFRSEDFTTAYQMWLGMAGLHGFAFPETGHTVRTYAMLFGLLGIVWLMPNSQQITVGLGSNATAKADGQRAHWRIQFSPAWALALAALLMLLILRLTATQRFIYYQF
jgi:ribose/xylose/arabinose/galactoside ABC-type transport system permease subunit